MKKLKSLIDVFQDTLKKSKKEYANQTMHTVKGTRVYGANEVIDIPEKRIPNNFTPIDMVLGGTVSTGVANTLYPSNNRVAILNFADALVPGGLVLEGALTQEENICRCSNLYIALTQPKCYRDYYSVNSNYTHFGRRGVYSNALIYSRDVAVFKDDITYEDTSVSYLDVITCPAPATHLTREEALPIYVSRIRKILYSAIDNGVDTIVLGAWGCGAFGQDSIVVASAFAQVLNECNYYFKKIIFAIRPTYMTSSDDLRSQTFVDFETTLKAEYLGEVIADVVR